MKQHTHPLANRLIARLLAPITAAALAATSGPAGIALPKNKSGASSQDVVPSGLIYYTRLPARTIHFPEKSLGRYLLLQPVKGQYEFHCVERKVGKASGALLVPANTVVQLEVRHLDPDTLAEIDKLKADDIQILSFSHSQLEDKDLDHIARMTGVVELVLSDTEVSDEGLKKLKPLKNLAKLEMKEINLTSKGLKELAALPNLEQLVINNARLDASAGDYLAQCKRLIALNLSQCRLKNPELDQIIQKLPKMKVLKLDYLRVSDQGLQHIETMKDLLILFITGSKVTDAIIPRLVKMKKLRELSITSSELNPRKLAAFKKALPNVAIESEEDEAPKIHE